jgi:transcriptional regulator with GAF, ATPase, and Fis domain
LAVSEDEHPPGGPGTTARTGREPRLAEVFVELADTLVEEFDVVDFLHTLTERCVELVDTDAAGLMLTDRHGDLQVVAHTDESARLLELFELQRAEGPCLDCFATGRVIANVDLADPASRWPVFAEAARGVGFTVSHALPMRLRKKVVGALNLFTKAPVRLDDEQLAVVQGLADIATIGLLHERAVRDQVVLAEQLQTALHSRIVIEQAKGVLSAQSGTSVGEAFRVMRSHARRTGEPLTAVAEAVVARELALAGLVDGTPVKGAPVRDA